MDINALAVLLVILNIVCALASNADVRDQRRKLEALLVRLESLRSKLQEVLQHGKVVRSTRAMLARQREKKEEELLGLQKELEACEEHAENEAKNTEGDEDKGEEEDYQNEEGHHEKKIGLSKGVAGQRDDDTAHKKPKEINVRSEKKRSDG